MFTLHENLLYKQPQIISDSYCITIINNKRQLYKKKTGWFVGSIVKKSDFVVSLYKVKVNKQVIQKKMLLYNHSF